MEEMERRENLAAVKKEKMVAKKTEKKRRSVEAEKTRLRKNKHA